MPEGEYAQPALPGFTDLSEIGAGRVGTVFRAREVGTDRPMAVKVFDVSGHPGDDGAAFARDVARLIPPDAEPYLVPVRRVFAAADGRPALAMDLCRSAASTLSDDASGVPVEQAVSIGARVAAALDAAHRAGLLHRHVTPHNVLITDRGEAVLGDLGEAILQATGRLDPELFDFVSAHAAPELLEGAAATPATDVYGLASTVYQLVAGHAAFPVYDGDSLASLSLRILRDPVPPLVAPGAPVQLSDLLLWGMEKDPGRRPPSSAMFALYLAQIQSTQGWPHVAPI